MPQQVLVPGSTTIIGNIRTILLDQPWQSIWASRTRFRRGLMCAITYVLVIDGRVCHRNLPPVVDEPLAKYSDGNGLVFQSVPFLDQSPPSHPKNFLLQLSQTPLIRVFQPGQTSEGEKKRARGSLLPFVIFGGQIETPLRPGHCGRGADVDRLSVCSPGGSSVGGFCRVYRFGTLITILIYPFRKWSREPLSGTLNALSQDSPT